MAYTKTATFAADAKAALRGHLAELNNVKDREVLEKVLNTLIDSVDTEFDVVDTAV